jgi:hypothetical protein
MAIALLPSLAIADGTGGRWRDNGNQTLTDTFTGLTWTKRDNLADVDWAGAKRYCDTFTLVGARWRLPEIDELEAIYSAGRDGTSRCTPSGWNVDKLGELDCKTSSLFYLSSAFFWSATPAKSDQAWLVNMIYGYRSPYAVSNATNDRALCVRRS